MSSASTVTMLLNDWREGDAGALERLTPIVYDDLRRVAARHLSSERQGHTLQATALVNEAFIRLAGENGDFENRVHFFAVAARLMRNILIDHARARSAAKRGGGQAALTLAEDRVAAPAVDILELDTALDKLAKLDARKSDILVLHYFGGMTYDEVAEATGLSAATVDRDLRFARAWLGRELAYE